MKSVILPQFNTSFKPQIILHYAIQFEQTV